MKLATRPIRIALLASLALTTTPVIAQQQRQSLRTLSPAPPRTHRLSLPARKRSAQLLDTYDNSPDPALIPRIDAAANQHDALWSRLYWYTDLDRAKQAAAAQHKPILYLRLMGKLTDEYSCANSRFFRTVLYADPSVSSLLRERFILVWQSERPVPVVSIDYGDGRVVKRTITGNSIHYVLSPDGTVVDALPGLLDPVMFTSILDAAAGAATCGSQEQVRSYQGQRAERVLETLASELQTLGLTAGTPLYSTLATSVELPSASDAALRAVGKTEAEAPLVQTITSQHAASPTAREAMTRARSKTLAELSTVTAIAPADHAAATHSPPATVAADRSPSKARAERRIVNEVAPAAAP